MGARVDTLFKFFSFSCSWHLSHILICNCVVVVLELSTVLSALFIRNVIVVLLTDFGFLFLFATVLGRNILFLFWFRYRWHTKIRVKRDSMQNTNKRGNQNKSGNNKHVLLLLLGA